jgi:hypothetical protein
LRKATTAGICLGEADTAGRGVGCGRHRPARVEIGEAGELGGRGACPCQIADLQGELDLRGKQPGPRQRIPGFVGQRGRDRRGGARQLAPAVIQERGAGLRDDAELGRPGECGGRGIQITSAQA